jgi:hypothetical protein
LNLVKSELAIKGSQMTMGYAVALAFSDESGNRSKDLRSHALAAKIFTNSHAAKHKNTFLFTKSNGTH